jgi:hypothetical protein
MLNSTIVIKVKQRLNKLDSQDYDNLQTWQILEAFNKGQVDWCRRQIVGTNLLKQGDEQSRRRVDDLQVLITPAPLVLSQKALYFEAPLPGDYFEYKKLDAKAVTKDCGAGRPLIIYQGEEVNVPSLLRDDNKKPSFEWGETFATLVNNTFRIYTNDEFTLNSGEALYYRQPAYIQIAGVSDAYTNAISAADVACEFKDDVVELLIDECAKILAGDIESMNQMQRNSQSVEQNN